MSPKEPVPCTSCGAQITAKSKPTFLGFPKFECPSCQDTIVYPLGVTTRIVYGTFFGLFGFGALILLSQGQTPTPGWFLWPMGYALIRDRILAKKVRKFVPVRVGDSK